MVVVACWMAGEGIVEKAVAADNTAKAMSKVPRGILVRRGIMVSVVRWQYYTVL